MFVLEVTVRNWCLPILPILGLLTSIIHALRWPLSEPMGTEGNCSLCGSCSVAVVIVVACFWMFLIPIQPFSDEGTRTTHYIEGVEKPQIDSYSHIIRFSVVLLIIHILFSCLLFVLFWLLLMFYGSNNPNAKTLFLADNCQVWCIQFLCKVVIFFLYVHLSPTLSFICHSAAQPPNLVWPLSNSSQSAFVLTVLNNISGKLSHLLPLIYEQIEYQHSSLRKSADDPSPLWKTYPLLCLLTSSFSFKGLLLHSCAAFAQIWLKREKSKQIITRSKIAADQKTPSRAKLCPNHKCTCLAVVINVLATESFQFTQPVYAYLRMWYVIQCSGWGIHWATEWSARHP